MDESTFTTLDPEMEAELLRRGYDLNKADQAAANMLSHIYYNLPNFPVYDDQLLPPASDDRLLPPASNSGVDRMSGLPREIRGKIISNLPVKDAAHTAALNSSWRTVWTSTPLVLIDAHLLPKRQVFRPTPADSPAIAAAVSRILETHPGPFSCIHLACCHMKSRIPQLERWLQLLAAKGIQDLVLVNRPWPYNVPLPSTVFTITTLTRLYLGVWKLPDMEKLRGVALPNLRELGLYCLFMRNNTVESLVARCPQLEILNILGCMFEFRLRLVSPTLRCLQVCMSVGEDIVVVKAPHLERLILHSPCKTRVKIMDAPNLHCFGYLKPGNLLEIGDTTIIPGMKVSTKSILSNVKILSLNVRFGVRNDVKMLPTFLKCFPNVERLHIMSEKCDKPPTGYLTCKFWEKSGAIESVSHIKVLLLREFRGEPSGVGFLEYFFRRANALKLARIISPNPSFTPFSVDELKSKLKKCCPKVGNKDLRIQLLLGDGPEGGGDWNLQKGCDLSFHDPFVM